MRRLDERGRGTLRGTAIAGRACALGRWAGCALLLGLALCLGCASPFASERGRDGPRLRHRRLGYAIDRPALQGTPGWKRLRLDEADFAIRHADGSALALGSSCGRLRASPRQLASHLLRPNGLRPVDAGEPVDQAGLAGFAQTLEPASESGAAPPWLRLRTLTLRGARCTYDWVLIAPGADRLAALRPDFDAWWRSFEPAAAERAAAEAGR